MTGVCQKCGCTEAQACDSPDGPCGWIDDQQDLCSRCAAELMTAPLDNVSDAVLAVRAVRSVLAATVDELIGLKQLVYQLAGADSRGELEIEVLSEIWMPGDGL